MQKFGLKYLEDLILKLGRARSQTSKLKLKKEIRLVKSIRKQHEEQAKRSKKGQKARKVERFKPVRKTKNKTGIRKQKSKLVSKGQKPNISKRATKKHKQRRKSVSKRRAIALPDKRTKESVKTNKFSLEIVTHLERDKKVGAIQYNFDATITITNLPKSNQDKIKAIRQWDGIPEIEPFLTVNTPYPFPRAVVVIFKIQDNKGESFYNSQLSGGSMLVDRENIINFVCECIAEYNNEMSAKIMQYDEPVKMFEIKEIVIRFIY